MDLRDEVFYHPLLERRKGNIVDMMTIDNDITSYNREQAIGNDGHNLMTVTMHQFNCDINDAMARAAKYQAELQTDFLNQRKMLPSWGPDIDKQINEYIPGVANWCRAYDCWCFESHRYFGDKGLEIQQTRCVPLLPKFTQF